MRCFERSFEMFEIKSEERVLEESHKRGFVDLLSKGLVIWGRGRYDHLEKAPLRYVVDQGEEFVESGSKRVCVSGDSLSAIMYDLVMGGII